MNSLEKMIARHEGFSSKVYKCSAGKNTIGYGRNIDDIGVSEEEALYLLRNDISKIIVQLSKFKWFTLLNQPRKEAIIDMVFNIGIGAFLKFKNLISCLEKEDFENASKEMLNSKWASQVGKRSIELSLIIKNGAVVASQDDEY